MPDFKITTTGTLSPVVFLDLGRRSFTHPTVAYDLSIDFALEEIVRSEDVGAALDAGYITATADGRSITSSTELVELGAGDMEKSEYDTDTDSLVDKSEALDDGGGNTLTAAEGQTLKDSKKTGSGNPNGSVSGNINDQYVDTDTDTPYINVDGTNTGWVALGSAAASVLVKVSAADTIADYLSNKLVVSAGVNTLNILETSILFPGANEDFQIQFDETKVDHDSLLNASGLTYSHGSIDTHIGTAAIHRSINDSGSGATDLWSAQKILNELASLGSAGTWQAPVLGIVDNTAAPPTEVTGDRYLLDDTGVSHANWDGADQWDIVEFDGANWVVVYDASAEEGGQVWDTDSQEMYIHDGTSWEDLPSSHNHDDRYYTETEIGTTGGSAGSTLMGTDTTNFDGLLSGSDDTVQKALDTLDDHTHDDRYYTETELGATGASAGSTLIGTDTTNFDGLLSGTEDSVQEALDILDDHNHDDRYYTETEIGATGASAGSTLMGTDTTNFDGLLSAADDSVQEALDTLDDHNHDSRYYTETELGATGGSAGSTLIGTDTTNFDGLLSGTEDSVQEALDVLDDHNHDDRYYTETELGATGASAGSTLIGTDTTNFDGLLSGTEDSVQEALDILDDHNHDSRYYTETEIGATGATGGSTLVGTDTTNFNNNLSGADNTVQKALDTLDNLSIPSASVFGTQFNQNSSDGESGTTGDTPVEKVSLAMTSLPSGAYIIHWSAEIQNTDNTGENNGQVQINDATTIAEWVIEPQDSVNWYPIGGVYYASSLSGNVDVDMDFWNTGSGTANIRRARIICWRVS